MGIVVIHKKTKVQYAVSEANFDPTQHERVRDLRVDESVKDYRPHHPEDDKVDLQDLTYEERRELHAAQEAEEAAELAAEANTLPEAAGPQTEDAQDGPDDAPEGQPLSPEASEPSEDDNLD